MKSKSQWSVRRMECPEAECRTEVLIEWNVEKGKKVLNSITCTNRRLSDYGGAECRWDCLEKIAGQKKRT